MQQLPFKFLKIILHFIATKKLKLFCLEAMLLWFVPFPYHFMSDSTSQKLRNFCINQSKSWSKNCFLYRSMQNNFSCTYGILPDLPTEQSNCTACQCKDQDNDSCSAIKNHRSANTSGSQKLNYYVGEKLHIWIAKKNRFTIITISFCLICLKPLFVWI